MIVLATGLPCSKKLEYFKEVKKLAKHNDKDLKIYSVGELIYKAIEEESNLKLNKKNILNMSEDKLTFLVQNAYLKIVRDMEKNKVENAIINTHAIFYWKNIWRDSNNMKFAQDLDPDLYITIIDSAAVIQEAMKRNKQWKTQQLTIHEILSWQNLETLITSKYWANAKRKRFFAIPKKQPAETLYKLMFFPKAKTAYASFPMTNLKNPEESNKKIDKFISQLREYFVVIDPRTVELSYGAIRAENNQTVHRDLDLFVGMTDMTVCYYPEIVHSSGAINETVRAHDTTKDVFHIIDLETRSPFTDYTAEVFRTPEEFFKELEKRGYKKLKFKRLPRPKSFLRNDFA